MNLIIQNDIELKQKMNDYNQPQAYFCIMFCKKLI